MGILNSKKEAREKLNHFVEFCTVAMEQSAKLLDNPEFKKDMGSMLEKWSELDDASKDSIIANIALAQHVVEFLEQSEELGKAVDGISDAIAKAGLCSDDEDEVTETYVPSAEHKYDPMYG